jgi:aryl-alcohol dehydrogenase-like predicted oxidoreductase
MKQVKLGKTDICVPKNGFGALPIQRIGQDEASALLRKAYDGGIRFFDTARVYTDSEEKIGRALGDVRGEVFIASKTMALNADDFWKHLEASLGALRSEYLDLYQFHNPPFCPKPGDGSGLYEAMLAAKRKGLVRHIGITNHRIPVAKEAIESGLYETLQFPFSYLADEREVDLVRRCAERDVGFIAMKALSGGLITNAKAAYAYIDQYENVLPIWGIQRECELAEFLACGERPPALSGELAAVIEKDRAELRGEFCRGCGYCMPCPAGIDIPTSARMSLLLRRAPTSAYLGPEGKEKMERIKLCLHCDQCKKRCPYGLDTPKLLERNWSDYKTFIA